MFNKIIKREGRKMPESESSSLDPSSPSLSPSFFPPLVSINHASYSTAIAVVAPLLSPGFFSVTIATTASSPSSPPPLPSLHQGHQGGHGTHQVFEIEPFPLLRNMPVSDLPALFLRKLRICSFLFVSSTMPFLLTSTLPPPENNESLARER